MTKVITLNSEQSQQVIILKAAANSAQAAARIAHKALNDYLASIAGVTPIKGRFSRIKLTDDNTTIIIE